MQKTDSVKETVNICDTKPCLSEIAEWEGQL